MPRVQRLKLLEIHLGIDGNSDVMDVWGLRSKTFVPVIGSQTSTNSKSQVPNDHPKINCLEYEFQE
jgi:hypothetical protein